jgi:hypothetical protein
MRPLFHKMFSLTSTSVGDPDPYGFGPPRPASGSGSQRYGFENPDPHPDPYQNVSHGSPTLTSAMLVEFKKTLFNKSYVCFSRCRHFESQAIITRDIKMIRTFSYSQCFGSGIRIGSGLVRSVDPYLDPGGHK